MSGKFVEEVYDSLQGQLVTPVPGVENAFEEGKPCEQNYRKMLDAYARLCNRLGVGDEDEDAEIMISSLLAIQRELCMKMYAYGAAIERKSHSEE